MKKNTMVVVSGMIEISKLHFACLLCCNYNCLTSYAITKTIIFIALDESSVPVNISYFSMKYMLWRNLKIINTF